MNEYIIRVYSCPYSRVFVDSFASCGTITSMAIVSCVRLLGVRVDNTTPDDVAALVARWIDDGSPHHLVTINPEFVMEARRNAAFRSALERADLAVPDGAGLLLAAYWRGQPLRARVPGVELVERIAADGAASGWRMFFLGAAPGIAQEAAACLAERYPGLVIAGCFAGSPRAEDAAEIIRLVTAAQPDILLVAYGHPAQDLWIAEHQSELRVPVAIGVGGTFDYLSGRVPRAPRGMRRLGLEWLYRLVRQPQRWRRIWTAVIEFPFAVLRHSDRL